MALKWFAADCVAWKISDWSSPATDQAYNKQHQENEKQDPRDFGSFSSDSAEAENSRDNRDYQENQRIMQHVISPSALDRRALCSLERRFRTEGIQSWSDGGYAIL